MSNIVSANSLTTGRVVFLAPNDRWVETIADAIVFTDPKAAENGLARAQIDHDRAIVVDPFVATTGLDANGRLAMSLRDTIRAYGPTIRFAPGKPGTAG